MAFSPFGTNNLRGPIGERLLDRGVPRSEEQIALALAASRTTEQAVAQVVEFPRREEKDADFAPAAEQAI